LKKTILLCSVLLVGACLRAADSITPLDVKLGQWENTTTIETSGQPPIPQEMLDRLTPEQRAKMEEMIKGRAGRGPRTTTTKGCLKKDDLNKAFSFGTNDKCSRTIITSSRSKQEIHVECTEGGGKQSGTIRVEALSSESVKGSSQMTMSNGDRTMNVNGTFAAKWLGPTCTERAQ